MSQNRRQNAISGFRKGKYDILVATDIAARGIDVTEISHVINYDMPDTVDAYTHRIGRTGRAGAEGVAVSFACEEGAFVLPDIEEYIERSLECQVPPEELLVPVPARSAKSNESKTGSKTGGKTSSRNGSPGGQRRRRPQKKRPQHSVKPSAQ